MTNRSPGDGGLSNPVVFNTVAEARKHKAKVASLDEMLSNMSTADRLAWFEINGNTPVEELE